MRRGSAPVIAAVVAGGILLAAVGAALAVAPPPDATADPTATAAPEPTTAPTATIEATPTAAVDPEPTVAEPEATLAPLATSAPAATKAPATTETPDADDTTPITTVRGVVRVVVDADGDREYMIGDVRLSVGPPWFWGDDHPLADLVGKTVTVTGRADDGRGRPDHAKPAGGPEFDVFTVNGATVREPGKPPWAGGPKVVGERHPGYAGWSRNHGTDD